MPEYMFVDYRLFGDIMDGMVAQLRRMAKMSGVYQFTHMYAPPRGGWPVSTHLSHHFPDITIVHHIADFFAYSVPENSNILFVDDIVDTGKTLKEFYNNCEQFLEKHPTLQYKSAALYYKPRTIIKPEIYMQEVPDDTWVVFPWEDVSQIEDDRLEFAERRLLEVRDKAIKTGVPIITAKQGSDPASEEDKQIWSSFLNVDEEKK